MNNNEKKFSLENFKKNVKLHKVKFVLTCVFIVLCISLLIFLSVLSLSDKNSNSASALSNDSRAYQYPEFGPSSNFVLDPQSSYSIPYFVPDSSTSLCTAFGYIREPSSPILYIHITSFYFSKVSSDSFELRYNGKYFNTNSPISSRLLITMTKSGNNFRCTPFVQGYCVILYNPSQSNGNQKLYHVLPQIPLYNELYNNGVSDGYDSGYGSGYDFGYSSGYNTALTDGLKNPVSFLIDPVREFLNAPLFGVVSVGGVLTVALFVLVAIMFIKMFAGG